MNNSNAVIDVMTIICTGCVTINLLYFVDYECPIGFSKCKDGMQCIRDFYMCAGNRFRSVSACKDGSNNDTDFCAGRNMWTRKFHIVDLIFLN